MLCVKCVINVVVCPLKCNNKTNSEYILGFDTTQTNRLLSSKTTFSLISYSKSLFFVIESYEQRHLTGKFVNVCSQLLSFRLVRKNAASKCEMSLDTT